MVSTYIYKQYAIISFMKKEKLITLKSNHLIRPLVINPYTSITYFLSQAFQKRKKQLGLVLAQYLHTYIHIHNIHDNW